MDVAITNYRQALRDDSNLLSAHYGLGEALERKGDLDAALKEYEKVVRDMPEFQSYREARDRLWKQTRSR
ncbi:MAG: hypothetical protein DMG13_27490 [Acidobacteria bacterium]|nr:MAG: hypothetical protein DMG13_27490 [Acidobacteriota bacterium]